MGKSLDQVQNEKAMNAGQGAVVDSRDVELAFRMGVKLLTQGNGLDIIRKAVNTSTDPAQVIGQFLAQIMAKLAEGLQKQYDVDPKIFLAKGGWLEHMLDFIEKKLGLPSNFSDQIFAQVVEVIKAAAQTPPAPNNAMDPNAGQAQTEPTQEQVPQGQPPMPPNGGMQ